MYHLGFPRGSYSKESACNAGDPGLIPGSGKIPRRREWQPTPVFLPGKSHGRRNLVGYSPWGHKESDTTERLTFTLPLISWWQSPFAVIVEPPENKVCHCFRCFPIYLP